VSVTVRPTIGAADGRVTGMLESRMRSAAHG
jgi:hypothetical protein